MKSTVITSDLRDFLIEHIDGPVPILVREDAQARRHLRNRAVSIGLCHPYPWGVARPTQTRLTNEGRRELCRALAEWADALILAQHKRLWAETLATVPHVAKVLEPAE